MTGINKDVVAYRDEKGGEFKLELSTGRLYDLAGNQVSQWSPVESETTAMLTDWVNEQSLDQTQAGLALADKPRAERMASDRQAERLVKMDLGVGDVHIPSALPNYASGYRNDIPLADVVCPVVLVGKPADKFYAFAKEDAFQRGLPTIGAGGAQVPEIAPRVGIQTFSTTEYALGGFVSTQLEAAADAALRIRQATAKRIKTVLDLEREIRVASLMFTAANYDSSIVATLGSTYQWDGGTASDPIADLQTRMEKSWGAPTGILMSEKLWHAFLRNPAVQKYFTYKDATTGLPSVDQVRQQFGLPPIYVSRMKYINTSGNLDYVWGNSVLMFRQPDQMPPQTQDDVATAYTFRWNLGNVSDGTTANGWTVREYFVQDRGSMGGNKVVLVHHDAEVITSKFVGGLLVAAYQ